MIIGQPITTEREIRSINDMAPEWGILAYTMQPHASSKTDGHGWVFLCPYEDRRYLVGYPRKTQDGAIVWVDGAMFGKSPSVSAVSAVRNFRGEVRFVLYARMHPERVG